MLPRDFQEIIDRLRNREPWIILACVVFLALIASAWIIEALQRLIGFLWG